ncbi:MAG: flippase [Gallionellaceae bacterium]|nr:flippase [Gallionellaceae bacterium]
MSMSRVVMRNLMFGVAGEAIAGVLNFLTLILVARALGAAEFGVLSYIMAFVGVFQLFADLGLTNTLVREIARERERVAEIMGALRPLAWASSLFVFALIAALGWSLSATTEIYQATLLLGLAVLATFHSFSYASVCRAFEEMGYNAAGNISHKILQILLVMLALFMHTGVVGVAAAMLAANLYQWLFFHIVVRKRYVPNLRWRVDVAYWRYLLLEAIPIGMAMVFRRANQQVGTLVLTALATSTSVGLFNAAYKIVQMIDMIPFTLSLPFFPPIARLAKESPQRLFVLLERVWRVFMIIAAPIVVWLFIMAPRLVELMFGAEYAAASATLRILTFAVLFLFVTALYAYLFLALQRQRFYTISSGLCLLANVLLGVLLIPHYGHTGAAVAALAGEIIFCGSGAWLLYGLGLRLSLPRVFGIPLLLAITAVPVLWWALTASLVGAIACSVLYAVLYLGLVVLTRTLRNEERAFLIAFVLRRPVPSSEAV